MQAPARRRCSNWLLAGFYTIDRNVLGSTIWPGAMSGFLGEAAVREHNAYFLNFNQLRGRGIVIPITHALEGSQ